MSVWHGVAVGLCVAGVACCVIAALGVLVMRGVFAKLHYVAIASTPGTLLLCAGVAVENGPGRTAFKIMLTALLILVTGAVVTMATARAAYLRRTDAAEQERP